MSRARYIAVGSLVAAVLASFSAGPGAADAQSDALLADARASVKKVQVLQADLEVMVGEQKYQGSVTLRRPNLARLELKGYATELVVSDGQKVYSYLPKQNQFREEAAAPDGANLPLFQASHLRGFFLPNGGIDIPTNATVTAAKEAVDGVEYNVLKVEGAAAPLRLFRQADGGQPAPPIIVQLTNRYYLGADHLIRRVVTTTRVGDRETVRTVALKNLRTGGSVADAFFAWTAPANATRYTPPPPAPRPDYLADLTPVGKAVPDFDLPMPGAQRLALHAALKQNKLTLLTFWFRGCPPCRAEHPHLQKLYTELKGKGFDVIAINRGDSEAVITQYFNESDLTFRTVMGGSGDQYTVGKAFGVRAYPTNFLVDSQGKVLWRAVGYSAKAITELREAITAAGIPATQAP